MAKDINVERARIRRVYVERERRLAGQDTYTLFNPGNLFIVQQRQRAVLSLLRKHGLYPLAGRRILEVGCGKGRVLLEFLSYGAEPTYMYGIDLIAERLSEAWCRLPHVSISCADGQRLPYRNSNFDLVLLFTVFSSILDDGMAHEVATEVRRVLKPGGAVLWYDFRYNNPWNPHVRGMTKRYLSQFFPGFELHLRTITLLPPLARRLERLTPVLYPVLATIPPLRTHYLGLLIKPKGD